MAVSLRPMNAVEMAHFAAAARDGYIAERIRTGEDPAHAAKVADEVIDALFPNGAPAPGHHLCWVQDDEQTVGSLWLGPERSDTTGSYWVWDITIDEAHRGRGIGSAVMLLAEEQARRDGATRLGLNVFGHNTGARRLYERLGYQVASVRMSKAI